MKKMVCQSTTAGVTRSFGYTLAERLTDGGTVLLDGELGSGKTTFVQGIAEGLGVKRSVTSATFTLMNIYATSHPHLHALIHIDLYRLIDRDRLDELDLPSIQEQLDALVVVEWPERAPNLWKNVLGTIHFLFGEAPTHRVLVCAGSIVPLLKC